jgi:hypothetical protein
MQSVTDYLKLFATGFGSVQFSDHTGPIQPSSMTNESAALRNRPA